MSKVIKTEYMNDAVIGYSEYFFFDDEARNTIEPVPGDRGVMKNGDLYFCWEKGIWEKIGG